MSQINLPIVEGELETTKNNRMIMVTGVIVIIVLVIFINHANNDLYIPDNCNNSSCQPLFSDCIYKNHNEIVNGRYVTIYNLRKKQIPVNKIIVIADNMIPVEPSEKVVNPNGVFYTFDLGKSMPISQLIIDVNLNGNESIMSTTQVDIRDENNKVLWYNCEPLLTGDRYIYIYLSKPKLKYPDAPEKLCTDNLGSISECKQEDIVNNYLAKNIWANTD